MKKAIGQDLDFYGAICSDRNDVIKGIYTGIISA
jgi:hypothetical protein